MATPQSAEELAPNDTVPAASTARLLAAVAEIADSHSLLADRRRAVLMALAEAIDADCGVWSWGRGWPDSATVAPVTTIDFGISDSQRAALMEWGFDPETDRTFRMPIVEQLRRERHVTTLWHDIFTPEAWHAMPLMRTQLLKGGWSSWLQSARYSDDDTWSSFFLLRGQGKPEFGPAEARVVDLVLRCVPWMHSAAKEVLPPETFTGLTPRQRTVMLMQLNGLARKAIAYQLGITEDTVGDHIKSIYAHFGVGSSSELASLFLRSR